jgi:hypothetical protein
MPAQSPLQDEGRDAALREIALALMDDTVYGYLVLTVNRMDAEHFNIGLASDVDPEYWPALAETLARILTVVR